MELRYRVVNKMFGRPTAAFDRLLGKIIINYYILLRNDLIVCLAVNGACPVIVQCTLSTLD